MSAAARKGSGASPDRRRDWTASGALGWADLVRALDAGGPTLLHASATLLGLEAKAPKTPPLAESEETGPRPDQAAPEQTAQESEARAPPLGCAPMPRLRYWYLASLEPLAVAHDAEAHTVEVAELPVWRTRPPPAKYAPLNRWEALLPSLRREMAIPSPSRAPDVREIVRRLGRGDILARMPRRTHRRWGTAIQILEDRSRRLTPYWRDQAMVRERLLRLFPRHASSHGLVDDALDLPSRLRHGRQPAAAWLPPPPGGTLLVLGDLGCLSGADGRACAFWRDIGREAARVGCRTVALTPMAPAQCGAESAAHWSLIGWERNAAPLSPEQISARVERLVDLLSVTVRVEPGLLRDVRRLMGFEAAVESAFWQHAAVVGDSSVAATLDPAELKRRRSRFQALADHSLRQDIWERSRAWRARLPGEVYLQEAALLDGEAFSLLSKHERALLDDFVDILSEHIRGVGGVTAPRGAEEWFLRLERLASKREPIWRRRSVHRLWAALHDSGAVPEPPPGFVPETVQADPDTEELKVGIAQAGDQLVLEAVGQRAEVAASPLGRISTRNRWVIVGAEESDGSFWDCGQAPPWATDWGWDEYGAWVAFSVEGKDGTPVIQRMRWIEPGSFQMGSPQDEPERSRAEDPRHAVRIEEGFWLFDTACTQALWEAVMGENPAQFKGAERPVEQVTWDDARRFVATLNERIPDLGLILPSEAQWEYACRAGTQTPFSFGPNVTPEQANYHGEYPYAGAAKGKYRGETVPVRSLPANPWGLYEMHGNVWEWVRDTWHDNYEGAPADGSPWESDAPGADRVFRGGSWFNVARYCRSAYRDYRLPVNRFSNLGFRCARAQGREPEQGGSGASGAGAARPAERIRPGGAGADSRSAGVANDFGSGLPAGMSESGAMNGARADAGGSGLRSERPAGPILLRLDTAAHAAVELPDSPSFEVRTDRERLTLRRIERPKWASAMGRDRFGLWAEIIVEPSGGEPVVQRLRWIPPGRCLMGSPADEPGRLEWEGPEHPVTIGTGYWLFDTPCTQALWQAIISDNPSEFRHPERPVEKVAWEDAQRFLAKLNERIDAQRADGGTFVLPSEAQWEYACRAGMQSAVYTGAIEILGDANAPALDAIAWYGGNSSVGFELENGQKRTWLNEMQYPEGKAGTHPVKGKQPNTWGLYDMLGNVFEWVEDAWQDSYEGASEDGSARESSGHGASRVIRGGSWINLARLCRSAYRFRYEPGHRDSSLGFRCARVQE